MYAIVTIAGQQMKVTENQSVIVHRLDAKEGDKVEFNQVLHISGATVSATVLNHLKGDKVIVFKKKRRKGYQKSNGHRQQFTKIQISGISA
ncbi:MAG: 50S ribosomal protein L21 [Bacteroidetes bacterium]|nr:50S ribosomal protein L21 [Bacteroidota bacterium]